jgi:carbamoyltransferase
MMTHSYRTLGINPGHNGSAALIVDGKIELYIEEERLSRQKYDGNPFRGILDIIQKGPIDEIILGGTSPNFPRLPWTGEDAYSALVRKFYPGVKVTNAGNEHHLGHAAGAFYNSGFDTAVAVVVDGSGSYHIMQTEEGQPQDQAPQGFETESIFHCKDLDTIQPIYKSYGNNKTPNINGRNEETEFLFDDATTITKVYEAVSHYLGFGYIEAGKTMGLAPYGRFDERMKDLFINGRANKNMIIPNYPAGANIDPVRYPFFRYGEENAKWQKDSSLVLDVFKNIAWMVQDRTQELVGDLIEKAIDTTGEKNVVLAGGYGLNCVANYYLRKRFPNINLYVDPVSHDGGTSIGLAKLAYFKHCKEHEHESFREPLTTLYLGQDRIQEIQHFADFTGGNGVSSYDNKSVTPEDVAQLLVEGKIVSIFQSRSEAGPRALGNRSIVYDPRVTNGKDIVNKVKGREWFRPFAGSVLQEDAAEWFDLAGMEESPFMMYAVDVQTSKLGEIPAITHVDNTCRVQTVTEKQNPHYYALIKSFKTLTGCPVVFNTSFNLAGDPLVETFGDAINTLERSELEYLYLPEVGKLLTKIKK